MSKGSWREDFAKLERRIAERAAEIGGLSNIERTARVAAMRASLIQQGVELSSVDENILEGFSQGQCTFDDLAKHFHGRIP